MRSTSRRQTKACFGARRHHTNVSKPSNRPDKSCMALTPLPPDFSSFLRLLNENDVEYLLVGGYAVGYYGYVRATADIDLWIPHDLKNADRLVLALGKFGFDVPELNAELFMKDDRIVRMGVPPMRIEIQTSISGVEFEACYEERVVARWDDLDVPVISLDRLIENKRAAGPLKDLADLQYLESL